MILIAILSILLVNSFAKNDGNKTLMNINTKHFANNDNSTNLGICYGLNTIWNIFPFIVRIENSQCSCTGSIIDLGNRGQNRPATILTAAHCRQCATQYVFVGCDSPRNGCGDDWSSVTYHVASGTFRTWGYNPNGKINDIAIFRLSEAITSPMAAEAITLNNNIFLNDNVNRITGYGRDVTGNSPNFLQTGITSFFPNIVCNTEWGGGIEPNMICILDPTNTPLNPGVTFADGDSGGPMTGFMGVDVQYGVMSFADENCTPYACPSCPEIPQVGTSVAHFIGQICDALAEIGGDNEGCPRS